MRSPPVVFQASGQSLNGTNATQTWYYVGYTDLPSVDARIRSFAVGEIGAFWQGLALSLPCQIRELGNGVWEVTATYSPLVGPESRIASDPDQEPAQDHGDETDTTTVVDGTISFANQSQTQKITQSLGTWQKKKNGGGVARDFKRAIGVNPTTGEVAGTDIQVSSPTFTLARKFPARLVTPKFVADLDNTVGKVNDAAWLGYKRGEVLLLGYEIAEADLSTQIRDTRFTFAVFRNKPSTTELAPGLTFDAEIYGTSYVWATYKTIVDGGRSVTVVDEIFEEQVYKFVDFNKLLLHLRKIQP